MSNRGIEKFEPMQTGLPAPELGYTAVTAVAELGMLGVGDERPPMRPGGGLTDQPAEEQPVDPPHRPGGTLIDEQF